MKTPAFISIFPVLTLVLLCAAFPIHAAGNFVVTTNSESGAGSLRQAIANANAAGGGTIGFSNVTGTIALTSGQLVCSGNLTVVGPGSANLAVSGGSSSRVFKINSGSTSSISGITIRQGAGGADAGPDVRGGGGVHNAGHLTLSNCVVHDNVYRNTANSGGFGGGGLCNQGTMALENCTVFGNSAHQGDNGSLHRAPAWGGGIFNLGILTVSNSAVFANRTEVAWPFNAGTYAAAHGGGIYNLGALLLTHSSVSDNSTDAPSAEGIGNDAGSGGGLYNAASATLIHCTINGNQCGEGGEGGFVGFYGPSYPGGNGGSGGGIYSAGTLNLTNCTIYGNASGSGGRGGAYVPPSPTRSGDGGNGGDGAGVYNAGTLTLASCTVSKGIPGGGGFPGQAPTFTNSGSFGRSGRGGGIWNQSGTAQLVNSVIGNNTASGDAADVGGSFASLGHNLISNTNGSVGFPGANDLLNIDPKLGPLTNNGGPTLTCALLPGSPAIDAGDDSLTGTDQRGLPRPSGAHVDIGAFEVQVPIGSPHLIGPWRLGNGGLRFSFTNTPGASFTVLATTNVAQLSTNWSVLGFAVENPPGWFEFAEPPTTNAAQRFYQIRWP